MRSLFLYPFQEVRHMVGTVEFPCQRDDVAALAQPEIIPFIKVGIDLEGRFGFLPQR